MAMPSGPAGAEHGRWHRPVPGWVLGLPTSGAFQVGLPSDLRVVVLHADVMVQAHAAAPASSNLFDNDHVALLQGDAQRYRAGQQTRGLAELRERSQLGQLRAELLPVAVAGVAGQDQHRERDQTRSRGDRVRAGHRAAQAGLPPRHAGDARWQGDANARSAAAQAYRYFFTVVLLESGGGAGYIMPPCVNGVLFRV
jgi:hypothetical protein